MKTLIDTPVLGALVQRIPVQRREELRHAMTYRARWNRRETKFHPEAMPSTLVSDVFERARSIRGWFTYDDCASFTLVLRMQSVSGMRGDILEIGCYHGRSTATLAAALQPGEAITVCDPMEGESVYDYGLPPSAARLRRNVAGVVPDLGVEQLRIEQVFSTDLELEPEQLFRFVHVDGSHEYSDALSDLRLARRHLLPGGVIALDDYGHAAWPDVTRAAADFLAEAPDVYPIADLNRHGEAGRKLYLGTARD